MTPSNYMEARGKHIDRGIKVISSVRVYALYEEDLSVKKFIEDFPLACNHTIFVLRYVICD